ncbi:TrbL/VirB6 plasmid conjugal transfer protein [Nocardioides terrae]|uniref:TrbL/VirB6 plasmid conjugal transfer protein n=1 Tax=Nocardioides terrae TaxID=574651 RepID=A0A1I1NHY1_9ACTN|nr:hypothetical protein [Nocardioides terrae]SFC97085.1 TrbL/VirB6 plasmid conjugal transfer protein [Nocardioides terrae]
MLPDLPDPFPDGDGCKWWNLACQGSEQVVDSGLSAITRATASGAGQLLGEIVKVVDESTQVPLADPTYRGIYAGFLALAVPLIGLVLFVALALAALRRDPGTLARAVSGLVVATLGGAFYIVFAQLLVGIDNYLSHGVVRVTGRDLTGSLTETAQGFKNVAGMDGEVSANMLLIVLMMIMLFAGLMLWFLLVLRKIAILVVVAFAPLLIAGYLWEPTRGWVRRATEVLVALIFTKTAIYSLFGIGLALLARGSDQGISDLVGSAILVTGACFAPFMMLRLVHFAGNTHLAGEMFGTLRGGMQPVVSHLPTPGSGRHDMARQAGQGAPPMQRPSPASSGAANPIPAASIPLGSASGGTAEAASTAGGPAAVAVVATYESASKAHGAVGRVADAATDAAEPPLTGPPPSDQSRPGPSPQERES